MVTACCVPDPIMQPVREIYLSPLKTNSYSSSCLSLAWCNYLPEVVNEMIGSQWKEHDVKMGFSSINLFLRKGCAYLALDWLCHWTHMPQTWTSQCAWEIRAFSTQQESVVTFSKLSGSNLKVPTCRRLLFHVIIPCLCLKSIGAKPINYIQ